jgi:chemotaxis protein methyltransferase CheR
MDDQNCVAFLQWCLPQLQLRWQGFRKVRKQVCKRIHRRLFELGIPDISSYRKYLENKQSEWNNLDSICFVTISRFYRDKAVFESINNKIFPLLIQNIKKDNREDIRCWCAGSCSGEEPYTLKILWDQFRRTNNIIIVDLQIIATDYRKELIDRAKAGIYTDGTIKEMPADMIADGFNKCQNEYHLKRKYFSGVEFYEQDIRKQMPKGTFDLILCRNLVFTYFSEDFQKVMIDRFIKKLNPHGFLIIGAHEMLPSACKILVPIDRNNCIFRKIG